MTTSPGRTAAKRRTKGGRRLETKHPARRFSVERLAAGKAPYAVKHLLDLPRAVELADRLQRRPELGGIYYRVRDRRTGRILYRPGPVEVAGTMRVAATLGDPPANE